jgi:lipopolysaccharide exporter
MNKTSEPDTPRLSVSAVRGVFWTGGGQVIRQIIQIFTSVLLARLLMPGDFGLVAMAGLFVGFTGLLVDFGIGAAIIQSHRLNDVALTSSFWMSLAVAATLALILLLAARPIAAFYDDPRVAPILAVLSIGLLISGLITVPKAIVHKAMNFAGLAKAEVVGSLSGALTATAMATTGWGVWSLVAQPLVGSSVTMILMWWAASWWPRLSFAWSTVRQLVHFSVGVFGANVLNYVDRRADNLLIGKFLGSGSLGYYALSYQVMLFPLEQVSSVFVRVLFPMLSRLQDDLESFREGYLRAVSGIATLTFPMMLGLLAVSHDFIVVVFGEKWLPMLWVLRVFCIVGLIQSVVTTVGTIYLSTGRTTRLFLVTLIFTPIFVLSFLVGLRWGIEGVAVAYACVSAAIAYVSLFLAFRIVSLSFNAFHKAILRPLFVSTLMSLLVAWFNSGIGALLSTNLRFALSVVIGVIIYLILSLVVNGAQVRQLVRTVRASLTP